MSAPSAEVVELAQRIIAAETASADAPADLARQLETTFARLHQAMATLVGGVGFAALMRRAIHLTRPACPCLARAEVRGEATVALDGLADCITRAGETPVKACAASLLGHVIGLLCSFIGDDLTLRLTHRVYSQVPRAESRHGPEGDGA